MVFSSCPSVALDNVWYLMSCIVEQRLANCRLNEIENKYYKKKKKIIVNIAIQTPEVSIIVHKTAVLHHTELLYTLVN